MNIRAFTAFAVIATAALTMPAFAETLTVPFTQPDGAVTTGLYDGDVKITISGTGQSFGTDVNDAFYYTDNGAPTYDAQGYFQLAFGTTTLQAYNPSDAAANNLVGALPAYNASHDYSFELNTGVSTPTQLHFGVSDGNFADNSGAYQLTISAAPEPSTWALMIAGVGLIGGALRVSSRRREFAVSAI